MRSRYVLRVGDGYKPVWDRLRCALQVTLKWKDLLSGNDGESIKMNVHDYIAPATLEAIGEGSCSRAKAAIQPH